MPTPTYFEQNNWQENSNGPVGSFNPPNIPSTPPPTSTNAVTVMYTVATVAIQVLGPNPSRKGLMLQNSGKTNIKFMLGSGPLSQSNFTQSLPFGSNNYDGSSRPYVDYVWQGPVQAISDGTGGILAVTELT